MQVIVSIRRKIKKNFKEPMKVFLIFTNFFFGLFTYYILGHMLRT